MLSTRFPYVNNFFYKSIFLWVYFERFFVVSFKLLILSDILLFCFLRFISKISKIVVDNPSFYRYNCVHFQAFNMRMAVTGF